MSTVVICLDGFKHEYLKNTDFLKGLCKKKKHGKLVSLWGFRGIPATFYSGLMPSSHGVWNDFVFSPKTSPFGFYSHFSFAENKATRKLFDYLTLLKKYFFQGSSFLFSTHEIPFSELQFFDTAMKKDFSQKNCINGNTFFDLLRKQKKSFEFFSWPIHSVNGKTHLDLFKRTDKNLFLQYLKALEKRKSDFFFFSFWGADELGHKEGPNGENLQEKVLELDFYCEKLLSVKGIENFLLWSDHGMLEVTDTVNVQEKVKDLKPLMFLDSTFARFWVKDSKQKKELVSRLNGLNGKILNEKDSKKFETNFKDKRFGDVIFAASPGTLVFPNYFQGKKPVKGMHGFNPEVKGQKGFYVSSIKGKEKELHVKEMFYLMQEFLWGLMK
jgi:predicted AlkP superfamily pyrophosphatase or phosphodiesterase